MKKCVIISVFAVFLLVSLGVIFSGTAKHDPTDLSYWLRAGDNKDWSKEAADGDAKAQFLFGLALIRTNLTQFVGRVPILSSVPVVGKRFEDVSYNIDSSISQEQLTDAYRWIRKSAGQGYAPAKEAEKLFKGRVTAPSNGGSANVSQPIGSE